MHLFERLAFLRGASGRLPDVRALSSSRCAQPAAGHRITEISDAAGGDEGGVADYSVDDFYYLARATLVKDERHLDRFDRVFGECFKGLEPPEGDCSVEDLPEEWLRKMAEKLLTEEEKAADRGARRLRAS